MTTGTTVELDPREVQQLADERARAEAAAQSAEVGASQAPEPEPDPTPAPEPTITPESHAATIDMLCGLFVLAGGRDVPPLQRRVAAQLTFEAARRYGGEIPYFVELCALGGLAILVREAFFVDEKEPPSSTAT